jgi:hypothetical protein
MSWNLPSNPPPVVTVPHLGTLNVPLWTPGYAADVPYHGKLVPNSFFPMRPALSTSLNSSPDDHTSSVNSSKTGYLAKYFVFSPLQLCTIDSNSADATSLYSGGLRKPTFTGTRLVSVNNGIDRNSLSFASPYREFVRFDAAVPFPLSSSKPAVRRGVNIYTPGEFRVTPEPYNFTIFGTGPDPYVYEWGRVQVNQGNEAPTLAINGTFPQNNAVWEYCVAQWDFNNAGTNTLAGALVYTDTPCVFSNGSGKRNARFILFPGPNYQYDGQYSIPGTSQLNAITAAFIDIPYTSMPVTAGTGGNILFHTTMHSATVRPWVNRLIGNLVNYPEFHGLSFGTIALEYVVDGIAEGVGGGANSFMFQDAGLDAAFVHFGVSVGSCTNSTKGFCLHMKYGSPSNIYDILLDPFGRFYVDLNWMPQDSQARDLVDHIADNTFSWQVDPEGVFYVSGPYGGTIATSYAFDFRLGAWPVVDNFPSFHLDCVPCTPSAWR